MGCTRRADAEWVTTGEAARLCSVTADAVQKWIRLGRLTAQRTAGGHYRIARRDIEPFATATAQARWFGPPPEKCRPQPLRSLSLEFASGGHQASTMVALFRPAFVVVDEEMLGAGNSDLLDCLTHETRIPGLKVILAASRREALSVKGDGNAFDGFIEKPFDCEDLAALVATYPLERVTEGR